MHFEGLFFFTSVYRSVCAHVSVDAHGEKSVTSPGAGVIGCELPDIGAENGTQLFAIAGRALAPYCAL